MLLIIVANGVLGQVRLPDYTITLSVKEKTLLQVLDDIAEQTSIPFSYNPRKISINQKITYEAKSQSLATVLSEIAEMAGFSFSFVD